MQGPNHEPCEPGDLFTEGKRLVKSIVGDISQSKVLGLERRLGGSECLLFLQRAKVQSPAAMSVVCNCL